MQIVTEYPGDTMISRRTNHTRKPDASVEFVRRETRSMVGGNMRMKAPTSLLKLLVAHSMCEEDDLGLPTRLGLLQLGHERLISSGAS